MRFGRSEIDPLRLWDHWVEIPPGSERETRYLDLTYCPNPTHDNFRSPAFQINVAEPLVHCFSYCGISGTYQHAICVIEGLYEKFKVEEATTKRETRRRKDRAIREARRMILRTARTGSGSYRVSKKQREKPHRPVKFVDLDYEMLLPPVALEYLERREISDSSISKWQLGWDPEEKRLVIPALDSKGKTRFLIKRAVLASQQPKYLYSEGFSKTSLLFGAGQIDPGMLNSEGLIIVEGSIDAIRLHQHGLRNTVAILGTGISEQQCREVAKLRPKKIFLFFDRDLSGVKNVEIASKALKQYPLFIVKFPKGRLDPAELTRQEAQRQIDRAMSVYEFRKSLSARRHLHVI
jgi:DNA primase